VSRQTNAAGAAVLAGLIAGGAVYASGHRVGDPALTASADARSTLMRVHPTAARHAHLLRWHPVELPKRPHITVAATAPAPAASAAPAPVAVASAPTTHTSPTGSGDDGSESEAGDD
jgi:hypothetical protein